MRADQTAKAIDARRRRTEQKLERLQTTLRSLRRQRTPVNYPLVAKLAGVSRTFLYENAEAAQMMLEERRHAETGNDAAAEAQATQLEASWRERALNAEGALQAHDAEIGRLRDRIAILMGQVRDLEGDDTGSTIRRLTSENTTLKRRLEQLSDDNRSLEERLNASRSSARFLDRQVADLEAKLTERFTASSQT
jgi:chromosome segregation ATPase